MNKLMAEIRSDSDAQLARARKNAKALRSPQVRKLVSFIARAVPEKARLGGCVSNYTETIVINIDLAVDGFKDPVLVRLLARLVAVATARETEDSPAIKVRAFTFSAPQFLDVGRFDVDISVNAFLKEGTSRCVIVDDGDKIHTYRLPNKRFVCVD